MLQAARLETLGPEHISVIRKTLAEKGCQLAGSDQVRRFCLRQSDAPSMKAWTGLSHFYSPFPGEIDGNVPEAYPGGSGPTEANDAWIWFINRSAIGVKLWYLFQIRYIFISRWG